MSELADLYQRVVIDHNRNPRHFYRVEPHSHRGEGFNPLCGDQVTLYLRVREGIVEEAGFQGESCAVATASASLLTEALQGRSVDETRRLIETVEGLIAGHDDVADADGLGELTVLASIRRFPGRSKCAALPWRTLQAALDGDTARSVSTETG